MRYDTILWDFDGTLVDTSPGLMECICHACTALNLPLPDNATLQKFIGPPLVYAFQNYMGYSQELAQEATLEFRKRYLTEGLYHVKRYPGLCELLKKLCDAGIQNAVTTLKPENSMLNLIRYLDMEKYFKVCVGSNPSEPEHVWKAQMVDRALACLGVTDRSRVALIGDTQFDQKGAEDSGVDFIAAAYGFGFLEGPKPECVFFAKDIASLANFLLS